MSNLASFSCQNILELPFFLLRDETYNLMESLVISFADSARDSMKSAVNFYFYSMRIHVEQACGTIGKRWGIYKAGLDMYFLRMI